MTCSSQHPANFRLQSATQQQQQQQQIIIHYPRVERCLHVRGYSHSNNYRLGGGV